MIRAGIVGATGYTGLEIAGLLTRHAGVEVAFATARGDAGRRLGDLFATSIDMELTASDQVDLGSADVLFLCLPHGAAQEMAARGLDAGAVVIDLSADHRLRSQEAYERWYGTPHGRPELLTEAVYGLPELRREALRQARLIANPGCYPTSVLLALAPLLEKGLLADGVVIADCKSGASGAGRAPTVGALFAEVNENVKPYNVGHVHRHVAEIEQEMAALAGGSGPRGFVFTPHLMPFTRGMLSCVYVPWPSGLDEAAARALYESRYAAEPFVWVLAEGQTATVQHTVQTNLCALSLHPVRDQGVLLIVSSIDNLLKGAAGQAVQSMNVRFGLAETAGLG